MTWARKESLSLDFLLIAAELNLHIFFFFFPQAEARSTQAGLGSKGSVKSNPNESYKDSVKRTLFSRYHEMD